MRPARPLPKSAPARLNDHPIAAATWRETMRTYLELEGEIVHRLDLELLISFCLLTEQLSELDKARQEALEQSDLSLLVKLDARADRKRSLHHKMMQSLYLTPRSRAGASPPPKPPEEPISEMDLLLNDVDAFLELMNRRNHDQ